MSARLPITPGRASALELTPATRAFFDELMTLPWTGPERPSTHEALTDILEIVAVSLGLRPAHLNGQGCTSPLLLAALEAVVRRHDLRVVRTPSLFGEALSPNLPAAYLEHLHLANTRSQHPDVLWIFRDKRLRTEITGLAKGNGATFTAVLGYPVCCVRAHRRDSVAVSELAYQTLRQLSGRETPEEVIAYELSGAQDPLPEGVEEQFRDLTGTRVLNGLRHFPFIGFSPCETCSASPESPAARINRALEQLAEALSPRFAEKIRQSSAHELALLSES